MAFALSVLNISNKNGEEFFALNLILIVASIYIFGGIMPLIMRKF